MVLIALALVVLAVLLGIAPIFVGVTAAELPVSPSPYVAAEDTGATLHNLAVFFTLLIGATVVIYLLFSKKKLLNLVLYFVWFIMAVGVVQFYAVLYYWSGVIDEETAIRLMWGSLLVGALTVYLLRRRTGDLYLGFLGALAGVMFVYLLPHSTVLALLAALPVYDYLMVRHGLLGKLVRKAKPQTGTAPQRGETPLFGFVVRLKTVSLGIGDFVIYAMALALIAIRLAPIGKTLVILAVLAGAALIYLGFRLTVLVFLRRWGYGPALPLPILMLSPLLIAAWIT